MPLDCAVGQKALVVAKEFREVFGRRMDRVLEDERRALWVFLGTRMGVEDDEELGRHVGEAEACYDLRRASNDDAS